MPFLGFLYQNLGGIAKVFVTLLSLNIKNTVILLIIVMFLFQKPIIFYLKSNNQSFNTPTYLICLKKSDEHSLKDGKKSIKTKELFVNNGRISKKS